jgi:inosose dehydratase
MPIGDPLASPVRVTGSPVSFGVFEESPADLYATFGPREVLASIAEAGFRATEAGPIGFLGSGTDLRRGLDSAGLELAAVFWLLQTATHEELHQDLAELDKVLGELVASQLDDAWLLLAVPASNLAADPTAKRSRDEWSRTLDGLSRAAELITSSDMQVAVHHHFGSQIETPADIERVLSGTELPLLLDTGHLALAGGSCVDAVRDWGSRIAYVHVKDARMAICSELAARSGGMTEVWTRGVFCELGHGDLPLEEFVAALSEHEYSGWIAIEQDRFIPAGLTAHEIGEVQAGNLGWLANRLSQAGLAHDAPATASTAPG